MHTVLEFSVFFFFFLAACYYFWQSFVIPYERTVLRLRIVKLYDKVEELRVDQSMPTEMSKSLAGMLEVLDFIYDRIDDFKLGYPKITSTKTTTSNVSSSNIVVPMELATDIVKAKWELQNIIFSAIGINSFPLLCWIIVPCLLLLPILWLFQLDYKSWFEWSVDQAYPDLKKYCQV